MALNCPKCDFLLTLVLCSQTYTGGGFAIDQPPERLIITIQSTVARYAV